MLINRIILNMKPWFFFLALIVSFVSTLASAATTYSGSNGVREKLLINNSVAACSGCHYNGGTGPDFTSDYSAFSSYATGYYGVNGETTAVQTMIDRTSLTPGTASFMPEGSLVAINAAEKALLAAWKANNAVDVDNPTTTTLTTISNKGKVFKTSKNSSYFTVYADVDDSGIDATSYSFQYGLTQSPSFESSSQTVNGSGGGTGTTQITQQLSNLDCGDIYYYRVKASNASYSSTVGGWQQEATPDCNTAPVIQNTPFSLTTATEDIAYQFSAAAIDGEGDGISYSLNNAPDGMTINGSGLVQWTPLEGVTSSGLVTVIAEDNGADGVVADSESFTISVTPVNDAPQITSIAKTSAVEGNLYSYQLVVDDPDDSGLQLTYAVAPKTGDMAINTSGLLTWTPGNGITTSGSLTVTVNDGGEDSAAAATQVFEILVSGVNTPPSIISTAPTAAIEDIAFEYSVQVLDLDDANNGSDLNFSLSNQPSGMTISNTGLIQWTPLEGQGNANNIRITVADGGENDAAADSQDFSLIVQSVNDAPELSNPGAQTVTELETLVLDLSQLHTDVDDDNDGTNLIWQLDTGPSGMSLSALGVLSWQTEELSAADYSVDVSLRDGGEDNAEPARVGFIVSVNLLDSDGDQIADYLDNCVDSANTEQLDFDQDLVGDICDSDDDNDSLPDSVELANNLNPLNASDALLDSDGDGESNQLEYQQCALGDEQEVSQCQQILTDSVAPEITTNGTQTLISQGYLTAVELFAQANDVKDGELEVSADFLGPFRPGKHIVTWQAQDLAGNIGQAEQELIIKPRVLLSPSTRVSATQVSTITLPLSMSGPAPEYPVIISYQVSGSAEQQEFELSSEQIQIEQGLSAEFAINWLAVNPISGEKTIIIDLLEASSSVYLAENLSFKVTLVSENIAPEISLSLTQTGQQRQVIYQDQGDFIVHAEVTDSDQPSLLSDWGGNNSFQLDNELIVNEVYQYQLDPTDYAIGFYSLSLSSSDGELSDKKIIHFRIEGLAPNLTTADSDNDGISDDQEGLNDSDNDGIQDFLDPVDDPQYMHKSILQNDLFDSSNQLLQTQVGLSIRAGPHAIENGQAGVALASSAFSASSLVSALSHHSEAEQQESDQTNNDKSIIGKVIDFEVHGLEADKTSIKTVLPLSVGIPLGAEYWLYHDSKWQAFSPSNSDSLASAFRQQGRCPDIESEKYQSGLLPFAQCLLLTIQDGGINDGDDSKNGVVLNTGAVMMDSLFVTNTNTEETLTKPSSSPGAGHISLGLILLSLLFLASRSYAEFNLQPLFEVSGGSDDNITKAEDKENIIADNFVRLDAHLIMDYEISFNKSISLELSIAQQEQQETNELGRKEAGGRIIYRWQNSFHYNSPWYQVFTDISLWDLGQQQRDSTFYTQQAMASARLTTLISGAIGAEYKIRDSESRVYDLTQSRIFLHLDYAWSDDLSLYSGYSYILGDVVTSAQSEYCNGLTATSVYYLLNASEELEQDSILNNSYCGNWISYRLPATTQTLVVGGNYGFGHSSSIDFSWLYVSVEADSGNRYLRNIVQVNYLKVF